MGKTVFFRAFEEEDADLIYQWLNDDELKKLSLGLNRRVCRDEALEWVKARMHHNPYQVWWAICATDSHKMIGYMSLTDIHYINSCANFSGIVIGDPDYRDGLAWIESYLFIYHYVFESLNLNRIFGHSLLEHETTHTMGDVMFSKCEGVMRQAAFKNGRYYDVSIRALLRSEYLEHKINGDYEISAILKRFMKTLKEKKLAKHE